MNDDDEENPAPDDLALDILDEEPRSVEILGEVI